MKVLDSKAAQLDDLLDRMAEGVQLDQTRYNRMITSYEAVKNWIEDDELFFKPYKYDVYPHGSVRILTTVKPILKDEFDLDIAIHLKSGIPHSPQKLYDELKRRLGENERYKGMIELKNRCIRLNYAGDFHMDILPGIQENEFDLNRLNVPDRELGLWVSSNPRGYADWFIGKANLARESLLEKAMKAEKLPRDDFRKKKPLQRAVQLIKRYRDIFFQTDDTYKTSSIILTTISGQFYSGEESIFDTIDHIVTTIANRLDIYGSGFKVLNPVNSAEDFTDKWHNEPLYYESFKKFSSHLFYEWQILKKDNGVLEEGEVMKNLFGKDLFVKAQVGQSSLLDEFRKTNSLTTQKMSGIISSASVPETLGVMKNTFFGGDEKAR